VEVVDGVAVIRFDDGKVNVISRRSANLLAEAHDRVASDKDIRAVVLAGRAGQFSAGFDLDALMTGGPPRQDLVRTGWDMLMRYFTLPVPLVIACTGNAIAAGAALLLTGDVRLAADGDFAIGFNEAAIGLPLPGLLLMLARDRLAPDAFDEATTGARMHSPPEAAAAGFVHRVVPAEHVITTAITEAARLAKLPAEAFGNEKQARIVERKARIQGQLQEDLDLMKSLGR
jgi:enoyl-CoA hydratase